MNQTTDAIAIFGPLWKRKWVILAVGILVAAGTYLYYKQATKVYLAETKLYLGAGAEEPGASERGGGKSGKVNAAEQATIVNSIVAEEVRKRLRAQGKTGILHGAKVRAKAPEKSLFINISAEAHTARGAALLANAAAQGYVRRQVSSHARAIRTQLAITRRQLARIEAASATQAAQRGSKSGAKGSSGSSSGPTSTANILQIANLNSHINELESQLGSSSARQLNPAKPELARLIAPTPRKNAIFGFLIGIVLASIGAYLVDRLDRRLRSLAGMEEVFGTQILTALPKVKRPIVSREGRPAPSRRLLEALRRLHTTLSLGPILKREGAPGGLILFLSPDPGDGKSTLVADLAIVQRDAGARVLVLDANLRRPAQAKLLATDATQGLADVLTGTRVLEEVLQPVMPALQPPGGESRSSAASPATVTELRTGGSLTLLAGGQALANPPAMLASEAMADLLRELADEFDVVLIDASSPIEVSDPMPLLALVSGVIVIGRVGHTREASAQRLAQMLHNDSFAPTLGIVANCASPKDIERYGLSTSRNGRVWGVKLTER